MAHHIKKYDSIGQAQVALGNGELLEPYVISVGTGNTLVYSDVNPIEPLHTEASFEASSTTPTDGSFNVTISANTPYCVLVQEDEERGGDVFYAAWASGETSTGMTYLNEVGGNFSTDSREMTFRIDFADGDGEIEVDPDTGEIWYYTGYTTIAQSEPFVFVQDGFPGKISTTVTTESARTYVQIVQPSAATDTYGAINRNGREYGIQPYEVNENGEFRVNWAGESPISVFTNASGLTPTSGLKYFYNTQADPQSITGIWTGAVTVEGIPTPATQAMRGTQITSVTWMDYVSGGTSFFRGCTGLTTAVLGETATELGTTLFRDCSSLNSITCYATTAPTLGTNSLTGVASEGTLYVPTGSDYSSWLSVLGEGWSVSYI